MYMIDLHCHSRASDGSCTPSEIVALAVKCGLHAIALTDHDTMDGLAEFRRAGEGASVECVPGIELASRKQGEYNGYHIVGLYLRESVSDEMSELLASCIRWRQERNLGILERLNEKGFPVTLSEVQQVAGGDVIGRPHIALALVRRGIVSSVAGAFERFLGSGKAAYMHRQEPSPEAAISAIHSMGGVAIWAHPFTKGNRTVRQIHQLAVDLKAIGLDGIEVHYSMHTARQVQNAAEIAREVGLLPSGGSDFHGLTFRNVQMGIGAGNLQVPDRYLEPLRFCASRWNALNG
ncbi:MAG: PHP domain-containing protein [Lentisphaeria bacterium]|nr:PHP domain-containing protein [Lentisphaeria bacterium]